jgi:AhpD family alkylhydroperoxidase
MTDFTIHSPATAPAASQPMLEDLQKSIGFIPALYGVLAEAPKALEAYEVLANLFKGTSLSTTEQHVVWLTINYENNCDYCVPAHTGLAKMDRVPEDVIESLRNGTPVADARLEVLRSFTRQLVQNRGWVVDEEVELFLEAGYTRQNILEVIVGMAHKVISNYTNHLARTPVDSAFKKFDWVKPAAEAAA